MSTWETAIDPSRTFDLQMGVQHGDVGPERTTATLDVHDGVCAETGAVHGGVFAAVAEGLASIGTFAGVVADGMAASGLSNDTRVLAEVHDGTISSVATRRDAKPDLWTWDVEARDGAGTLCAVSTVLIAVRPQRR